MVAAKKVSLLYSVFLSTYVSGRTYELQDK